MENKKEQNKNVLAERDQILKKMEERLNELHKMKNDFSKLDDVLWNKQYVYELNRLYGLLVSCKICFNRVAAIHDLIERGALEK